MVAVKVFTNQVSSDGHGRDEIAAAVAAGVHPNLVSTRAPLCEHPTERAGLILDLIPEGFHIVVALTSDYGPVLPMSYGDCQGLTVASLSTRQVRQNPEKRGSP